MKKSIRSATVCHNDDDHNDPNHRRVRLELVKDGDGYSWRADGEDAYLGLFRTVRAAMDAAIQSWGAPCWDLMAKWR